MTGKVHQTSRGYIDAEVGAEIKGVAGRQLEG
jgi:hypothetical protein